MNTKDTKDTKYLALKACVLQVFVSLVSFVFA